MVAGTSDNTKHVEQLLRNGLRANHCYSILSLHTVKLGMKNERVVKLRNPWGHEEWNGAEKYRTQEAEA